MPEVFTIKTFTSMKKKKRFTTLAFMSWKNQIDEKNLRAIALCDCAGHFDVAINCIRDSDMGKKDKNGVYERLWYADYISCYGGEEKSLRLATKEEVDLYLDYVSLDQAIGLEFNPYDNIEVVSVVRGEYGSYVIAELKDEPWWKKLLNKFRKHKKPF